MSNEQRSTKGAYSHMPPQYVQAGNGLILDAGDPSNPYKVPGPDGGTIIKPVMSVDPKIIQVAPPLGPRNMLYNGRNLILQTRGDPVISYSAQWLVRSNRLSVYRGRYSAGYFQYVGMDPDDPVCPWMAQKVAPNDVSRYWVAGNNPTHLAVYIQFTVSVPATIPFSFRFVKEDGTIYSYVTNVTVDAPYQEKLLEKRIPLPPDWGPWYLDDNPSGSRGFELFMAYHRRDDTNYQAPQEDTWYEGDYSWTPESTRWENGIFRLHAAYAAPISGDFQVTPNWKSEAEDRVECEGLFWTSRDDSFADFNFSGYDDGAIGVVWFSWPSRMRRRPNLNWTGYNSSGVSSTGITQSNKYHFRLHAFTSGEQKNAWLTIRPSDGHWLDAYADCW